MLPTTRHSRVPAASASLPGSLPLASLMNMLGSFAACFTRPSFAIFWRLVIAWVICPGRHTITRLYLVAEPEGSRGHDAYHHFLRAGAWGLEQLWRKLTIALVDSLCLNGTLHLAVDDTIFQKWGRKVEGSGRYKDPVRSSGRDVVFVTGLTSSAWRSWFARPGVGCRWRFQSAYAFTASRGRTISNSLRP